MRKILTITVSLSLAILLAPPAAASDTASGSYTLGGGVRVFHGIDDVPTGRGQSLCALDLDTNGEWDYCIGGRSMVTTECLAIRQAGGDCTTEATLYTIAEMTVVDSLFGNNVYGSVCLWNTLANDGSDNTCNSTENPLYAHVDARAAGCGIPLVADAAGIPGHDGNYRVTAFLYTLTVDPSTNEICTGSTGDLNVVFS